MSTNPPGKAAAPPTKGALLDEKMKEIRLREQEKQVQERAASLGLPYISLRVFPISPEALSLIPRDQARAFHVIPFFRSGSELRFGVMEPGAEIDALVKKLGDEYRAHTGVYLISQSSFDSADKLYDRLPTPKEIIYGYRIQEADLEKYEKEISGFEELQAALPKVNTTDVLTLIIGAALRTDASDIHIEAEEEDVKVRFRLDGILQDAAKLPKAAWKQMISRLKLLAGVKMNIEDVPQDGRITIYLAKEKIDIRVSFLPTAFGESVVMRILRPKTIALEYEKLGLRGLALERMERETERPNGMIITTGPTGSGKTTTLYAILKKLNKPGVKIITLEDPVEYKLEGINQSQVDAAKHYDFAGGLRSILRQDPDVVMVGEIRDLETAETAIQASLTGHLVISTLHTNSAAGAIPRFLSMGVKPFLLSPSLNAVMAQRLVRRLCPDCKKPAELPADQMETVKRILTTIPEKANMKVDLTKLTFSGPGPGCATCHNLSYKGRVGIYEIFTMNKDIEAAILSSEISEYKIEELAVKDGMITMAQDGLLKALDGLTSVEEVLSVANVTDPEA